MRLNGTDPVGLYRRKRKGGVGNVCLLDMQPEQSVVTLQIHSKAGRPLWCTTG